MTFEKRLVSFFVLILTGFSLLGILSWQQNKTHAAYNGLVMHTQEVLSHSRNTLSIIKDLETGNRGYAVTGDSTFLHHFFESKEKIAQQLGQLKALTRDNSKQQSRIDSLMTLTYKKLAFSEKIIAARNESGLEATKVLMESLQGENYMEQIRELMAKIEMEENDLLIHRIRTNNETEAAFNRNFYWLLLGAVMMLLVAFLVIRQNLIARRKVERELYNKNEWYHQTLISLGDGVIATDANGVITYLNRAAQELTGWKQDEAVGIHINHVFHIIHERTGLKVVNPLMEAIRKNEIVLLANHTILKRKDNSELFIDDSGAPVHNQEGEIIGGVLIFRDITEKKIAEDKVVAAEKRVSTVFNISPVAIAISTFDDGKFMYVNDAYCNLVGMKQQEIIGNKSLDLKIITAEERQKITDLVQKQGGSARDVELQIQNRNGELTDVLYSMEKVELDNQICLVSYLVNISKRKKAENQIRVLNETLERKVEEKTRELIGNEIYFKNMLDNLKEGIQIIDRDFRYFYINNEAARQGKYPKEELLGQLITEKYPGIEDTPFFKVLRDCMGKRVSNHMENEFHYPDRSIGWYDLIIEPVEEGILIISADITERKKSNEEIKQKNIFIDQLIKTQPVAFYVVSARGFMVTFMTENIKDLTGYSAQEFIEDHRLWPENIHPEDKERVLSLMESIKEDTRVDFEYRWKRKDGAVKWFLTSFNISEDHSGKKWLYGSVIDLTERKNTEKILEIQNQELIKRNSELDRFVYSASHDLRAPLTSLLGLIAIAEESLHSDQPEQQEYFGMMKRTVHKLDGFIGDILNYSYNSRNQLVNDEIDFEVKVNEVIENLKFIQSPAKYQLNIEVRQRERFITDKRRIYIILNNLISNGIKYQDPNRENPFLNILVDADKPKVIIVVEDNGIGIAEEDQEKIFEMFYRATKTSTGSGLGMYILKEALDKLQGTVQVESQLNRGSKFTVTIPNFV